MSPELRLIQGDVWVFTDQNNGLNHSYIDRTLDNHAGISCEVESVLSMAAQYLNTSVKEVQNRLHDGESIFFEKTHRLPPRDTSIIHIPDPWHNNWK